MGPKKRVRYFAFVVVVGLAFFAAYALAVAKARVSPASAEGVYAAGAYSQTAADGEAACSCCGTGGNPTGEPIVGEAVVAGDVQTIAVDVTQGYYDPDTIVLAAGIPAVITFSESSGCTAEVVSEDLGFYADLTQGPQTVQLPALEPGEYGFSCGMQMVFGKIVVQ